jgi:hypothetical protein
MFLPSIKMALVGVSLGEGGRKVLYLPGIDRDFYME